MATKKNRGKGFEREVRDGFEKILDVSVDRLKDTQARFKDNDNVADFIIYSEPTQIYIECKTRRGNTLNFKNDIRPNQWQGLYEKSLIKGVKAGILVWFIDHDITAWVDIATLQEMRANGEKSLHYKDIEKYNLFKVSARKKQVYYEYDFYPLLQELKGA